MNGTSICGAQNDSLVFPECYSGTIVTFEGSVQYFFRLTEGATIHEHVRIFCKDWERILERLQYFVKECLSAVEVAGLGQANEELKISKDILGQG
ncbi:hypothetical protein LTS12_026800 [Elasticomyces elasticus]|nr:hypothetical protein LTS12_026800 [Elasticomyces elasticus]